MKTLQERFDGKYVVAAAGCWQWTGARQPSGYGQLWNGARPEQAHRIAYRLAGNALPKDREIDHVCRNRGCVNPAHLRAVSHRENMRCSDTPTSEIKFEDLL